MEAHVVLGNAGLTVESYGTGTNVRLPGRTAMEPRIFKFGTPYSDMYASLAATPDDETYFAHNGVLNLCRRGASVKPAPQRWQDTPTSFITHHDIVIAFEERIFDAVVEDLQMRECTEDLAPIHIICLDTKDNPQEAKIQGRIALELCWILETIVQEKIQSISSNKKSSTTTSRKIASEMLMDEISEILESFQQERMSNNPIKILYQLCFL
jgi:RNA polymerase II subunit A C-terminal domain phosphatase SSU72